MSSVIRMMMRLSQRESRATQSQINRLVRAVDRSSLPTADAIRPVPVARPSNNVNVNVYLTRGILR